PDPSRDRGEERIEATHFLDEGLQIGFVPFGEGLPPLRMASQRHCREYDESCHGQDRAEDVDEFHGGHLGAHPLTAGIGVMGEDRQGGALARIEPPVADIDRKSTRLNSSHVSISYAVFCLKKKK